jgi:hypothetical protein
LLELPTKRRNVIVIIQTRDLDEIRVKIQKRLKKFDSAVCEIVPGIWHLAPSASLNQIKTAVVMTVSDWEDDRVLVIDNPDGWSTWDGHSGQHVRTEELKKRWVRTVDITRGKIQKSRRVELPPAPKPHWVEQRRNTGTKIV